MPQRTCGRRSLAVFALGSAGGAVGAALLGAVGGLLLGGVGRIGAAVGRVVRLILCHERVLLSQVKNDLRFCPHW